MPDRYPRGPLPAEPHLAYDIPVKLDKEDFLNRIAVDGVFDTMQELFSRGDDPAAVQEAVNKILGIDVRTEPWETFPLSWPEEDPSGRYIVAPNWESNPFRYANYENVMGDRASLSRRDLLSAETGQAEGRWKPALGKEEAQQVARENLAPLELTFQTQDAFAKRMREEDFLNDIRQRREKHMKDYFFRTGETSTPQTDSLRDFIMKSALSQLKPEQNIPTADPRPVYPPTAPLPGMLHQIFGPLE